MALPVLTFQYGDQVVTGGTISRFISTLDLGTEAVSTTEFSYTRGGGYWKVEFHGDFTVSGGAITGGTVTDFAFYSGTNQLLGAAGYSTDAAALYAAIHGSSLAPDIYDLLFNIATKQIGSPQSDALSGWDSNDTLKGQDGSDTLAGWGGDDLLKGGKGDDYLSGDEGMNSLWGNGGKDLFVFELSRAEPHGLGKIKDFQVGKDHIMVFLYQRDIGALHPELFHKGTSATTEEQRIIYDKPTGKLYYDPDGSASEYAQYQFAKVTPGTKLGVADFLVQYHILLPE